MSDLLLSGVLAACVTTYTSVYLTGIFRGTVKPILATWLFFAIAVVLSFLTNFARTGTGGLLANALNIFDGLSCLLIFFVIVWRPDIRKRFTTFEKWCIGTVTVIFICWLFSGQNVIANVCTQAIVLIAYLPTMRHVFHSTKNSESLGAWSVDCAASILGLIIPLKTLDLLPILYASRSFLCTGSMVLLILRLKWKEGSVK